MPVVVTTAQERDGAIASRRQQTRTERKQIDKSAAEERRNQNKLMYVVQNAGLCVRAIDTAFSNVNYWLVHD